MSVELPPSDAVLARFLLYSDAGVKRVSFEVNGEQVSAFARQGKLRAVCTCGAEACEHQQLAWSFLGVEGIPLGDARARSSLRPPAPTLDFSSLADALDELCLAAARAGLSAADSLAIREALDQVVARAPSPPSSGLTRWVGRFNEALTAGEVGLVAQLLDGARRFADELRAGDRSPAGLARRRVWLGGVDGPAPETLSDSVLVEVGRERLTGLSRNTLERRYLVDVHTGELFREERRKSDQEISVGPCPRVVQLAFAELDSAMRPRRLRLLQYTVSPEPTQAQWSRVAELAERDIAELARRYAESERTCPAQSEPLVMFTPAFLELGVEGAARDASGKRLALLDDTRAPAIESVRAVLQGGDLVWIAGRLLGLSTGLALRPISVLVRHDAQLVLRRIT